MRHKAVGICLAFNVRPAAQLRTTSVELSISFTGGEYREIVTDCVMLITTEQEVTSRKEGNWWDFPNWGNSSKQITNRTKQL